MKNKNYYLDNDDLVFHVSNRLDFEKLFNWLPDSEKECVNAETSEDYKKVWREVLETFGEICGSSIAPNAKELEHAKVKLENGEVILPEKMQENLKVLKEFGAPALSVKAKYGGMGGTLIFDMIGCEVLNRACPSTLLNSSWYGTIAHILEEYGSQELKDEYIPRIASGELSGNMALTEPDAGSDLAALRTYAEKDEDGSYRIHGSKRFISNGNSELSLVLAKNKKGAVGLEHLSLFLCPRKIDDKDNIKITKIEEKVALHGSATCELAYDGSKAWLIGEHGQGYRYMLDLMNDSRLGVGFQGVGLMEACWRMAKEYANERETWGKPIAHHELVAEKLLDLEVELKATRSLGYQASFCRAMMYAGEYYKTNTDMDESTRKQIDKEIHEYRMKGRALTPLLKYWVGEKSVEFARRSMQVLGGYGFTTEYPAEKWVRESLIYSLYEGTSQMQALMCVKDTIKGIINEPKEFVESYMSISYKKMWERNPLQKKYYLIQHMVCRAILSLIMKLLTVNLKPNFSFENKADILTMLKSLKKQKLKFENLRPALLHAERICEMKCYEALADSLISDIPFHPDRKRLAERFVYSAYPKVKCLLAQIVDEDEVINDTLKGYDHKPKEQHLHA
ncbi:MAG: acyl-CoA dehydrogenase family protein [Oligoflexales bacterium]|nr:acyl-CoA dehydrogenase family protein [Oligoflexales bacterium]